VTSGGLLAKSNYPRQEYLTGAIFYSIVIPDHGMSEYNSSLGESRPALMTTFGVALVTIAPAISAEVADG
jgi:hypothetical protein